ncbi:MAG TPA: rhodanese-like domain-containing protein [Nevskiaceae bacterium]|nr:rhodanese-like domain-containing protein [Nevskiaceae bacterium]
MPPASQLLEFFHNHTGLFLALAVVLVLIVANEVHGALTGGKRLSALEAVRLINDRDPLIVDVRPPAEFKRGHLVNAINLPLAKLAERVSELGKDKNRPLLLVCTLGSSSADASRQLRALGFTEAYPLRGGLNAWLSQNLPVTTK